MKIIDFGAAADLCTGQLLLNEHGVMWLIMADSRLHCMPRLSHKLKRLPPSVA